MATTLVRKLVSFDWAIKYLLRNKANFKILEGFLSELLKTQIKIESILESEGNKNTFDNKGNQVDLLVQTGQNERVIIEVQCNSQWDYLSRILYSASKTINEHLKQGLDYYHVCKIISVNIVFFDLGEGKDYLYHGVTHFKGMHYQDELKLGVNERKLYGEHKTPTDIFPEYYIIKVNQFRESIKNKFDEWVYFLKNDCIKPEFEAQGIQMAAKALDVLKLPEAERLEYEQYQKNLHYQASMALPYDIGKKEGKKEVIQETVERMARNLLQQGISVEVIATVTGLTSAAIRALQTHG